MGASDPQARKYIVVINNPEKYGFTRTVIIDTLEKCHSIYYCLADEIGAKGTRHTHIYICLKSPMRFSTLKNRFPIAHIEKAIGTSVDNRNYILKKGKWAGTEKSKTSVADTFYEKGDCPDEQKEKYPLMTELMDDLKAGTSLAEVLAKYPNFGLKINQLEHLQQTILAEKYGYVMRDVNVIYVSGPTGVGKTTYLHEYYNPRDICRIVSYGNLKALFDQYRCQSVLVFEEFRSQIPIAEMLSYLDRFPLMLPARYNDKVACYTTVYLHSNIPLEAQYTLTQRKEPETWKAFLRRIKTVRIYTAYGVYKDYPCAEGGWYHGGN